MKKFLFALGILILAFTSVPNSKAADAAPAAERTVQERLEDLEA